MFRTRISLQWLILATAFTVQLVAVAGEYFKPFNVSYDYRARRKSPDAHFRRNSLPASHSSSNKYSSLLDQSSLYRNISKAIKVTNLIYSFHDDRSLGSMGKGQAWVNGHYIGRYWTLVSPKDGCKSCDYRGAFNSDKCTTNCGEPTQIWYHIPRSWLERSKNILVLFEQTGGNPFEISIKSISTQTICGLVSETHYPPLHMWSHPDLINGKISVSGLTPEMQLQCEDGHTISSIEFASYGTPQGNCQNFSNGKCHARNSLSVVSKACKGRNSCSVGVSNAIFGGDPCRGIVKTLSVEARCSSSSFSGFSAMK